VSQLVDNERTKLVANALDRASTACFTVGILTPTAAFFYDLGGFRSTANIVFLVAGLVSWLVNVVALHYWARRVLRNLR
jgi:hypothetical protein